MQQVLIHNQTRPARTPLQAQSCDSFIGRLRGLMFRASIAPHEGLLMIQPRADRLDAAIHMFFMRFDITVVWADAALRVVDVCLARRWRPAYMPRQAALYVLETHPARLNDFKIGDQLVIEACVNA
jgi:uncharacterized membrane protein (UPF0127 family)